MKMLIRTCAALLALASAGQALAQARPDTWRMSCAASADMVRRYGALVMHSGPDIYDRYVSSHAACYLDEETVPRWVPAADNPQCFIGYVCQRRYGGPGPR